MIVECDPKLRVIQYIGIRADGPMAPVRIRLHPDAEAINAGLERQLSNTAQRYSIDGTEHRI